MSDTTTSDTDPQPALASETAPRNRWRPRRLHWHLSIWTLVTIGLVGLFLTLASMSLTGRVMVLPDWASEKILSRLNAASPAISFSLRQVEFGVTPRGRPKIRLVDVGIRDASGLQLGQLNGVEGGFRLGPALVGRFEPSALRLQGGQVTLRRFSDGAFALSLGQDFGTTGNLAAVLDRLDGVFNTGPLAGTSQIEASDLTITLEDARSGRIWQVTDGRMEIVPRAQVIDTIVRFDVFNQTEELASTELSFRSARDTSEASLTARFENAAARDIAAQSPALAFLSVIDAPISGALRSSIDPDGSISELVGMMEIGEGALSPEPSAQPAKFNGGKIYIDFDPARQRIDFQGAKLESELGMAEAEGHVYLTEFRGGWPNSLVGQVDLIGARLDPRDMFGAPLDIDRGVADLRVRLDPFTIDIGQAVMFRGDHRYDVSGTLGAESGGWRVALDARTAEAGRDEVLGLWPTNVEPVSREWVAENVSGGAIFDTLLGFRKLPGETFEMTGTMGMREASVQVFPDWPDVELGLGYLSFMPEAFTVTAEAASVTAPDGSLMTLDGLSYQIPRNGTHPSTGIVHLAMAGPVRGALSLLDLPPLNVLDGSGFAPDMARGEVSAEGRISFPLVDGDIPKEDVRFALRGTLDNVTSDVIVPGKLFAADSLTLEARDTGIEISGPARIGQAELAGVWRLPLDRGAAGASSAEGTIEINQRALTEFGLDALEGMVSGTARGSFALDLAGDGPPVLDLSSDLGGLEMSIPGTGWSKPARTTGGLALTARLGDRAEITALDLEAPGLSAGGTVTTVEGGGLGEARFDRVEIGGWLDAPVVLTGRGIDQPIAISVPGGSIDMRRAQLDPGDGGSSTAGPRQPLTLSLDRLIVSEGITISALRADLDLAGGLNGTFTGNVAADAPIQGTIAQSREGAAFRITSSEAGNVLRGANVFNTARGGDLELVLAPVRAEGTYEGEFTITDTRIVNAPAMAELLSAISVIGLLEQAEGEGIRFSEVSGRFRLDPNAMTLYRSSAIGASLGVSIDGYYDLLNEQVDMQGVLSPFYLLNSLGRIFSPRDGEGLVGFNFDLKGDAENPEVGVNPLSILTPGVFREIFRRPPPEAPKD
jgi:hypothetical protein